MNLSIRFARKFHMLKSQFREKTVLTRLKYEIGLNVELIELRGVYKVRESIKFCSLGTNDLKLLCNSICRKSDLTLPNNRSGLQTKQTLFYLYLPSFAHSLSSSANIPRSAACQYIYIYI